MDDLTALVLGGPAAAAAGATSWRTYAPRSFWRCVGFPAKALQVKLSWRNIAEACGLSDHKSRRTRDGKVTVTVPPKMGLLRPTSYGWTVQIRLHAGQTPAHYAAVTTELAHAWACHSVRVAGSSPGKVRLAATVTDPLTEVPAPKPTRDPLSVSVGVSESGEPWVIDLRTQPHWLNAGATQSGKSTLVNALVTGLAPQDVALVGFDLKGGMELSAYEPRLTRLATTRAECVDVLTGLVDLMQDRMDLCRQRGARDVFALEGADRPTPVVVFVDEVAELFLMADKTERDEVTRTSTSLLRVAQLGRALGVYLVVAGQRFGSDLGSGVTALRSQLSGRVCHRVNDPETATMTLGDLDPDALEAARAIPPALPGVAIVATDTGSWMRARAAYVSPDKAAEAAREHATKAPTWDAVLHPPAPENEMPPARLEPPQPTAPEAPTLTTVPDEGTAGEELSA